MSHLKISVFIPVFRESSLLESLLECLMGDPYPLKEVICVIDNPTEKSLMIVKKFGGKVKFILNGHRIGKVNALNEAFNYSTGDVLLFLDSDVKLPENLNSFLEEVVKEIKDVDLLDIKKKTIRDSFIAKITHYDYLCNSITNWFFSKTLRKCLGFNGAAFAIKREAFKKLGGFRRIVSEDLDLGTRSFLEDCKFKQAEKLEVYTKVPSTLKAWYGQRKRWGIGVALWIKENYKTLAKIMVKFPKTLIPSIFIISPSIILFLISIFIPTVISYESSTILLLTFLSSKLGFLIPPTLLVFLAVLLIKNLTLLLVSLLASTLFYYVAAKKLNYRFNPAEFLVFYLFLSPLWLLITVTNLVKVFFQPNKIKIDWKV